jgi:hypothetical protein
VTQCSFPTSSTQLRPSGVPRSGVQGCNRGLGLSTGPYATVKFDPRTAGPALRLDGVDQVENEVGSFFWIVVVEAVSTFDLDLPAVGVQVEPKALVCHV